MLEKALDSSSNSSAVNYSRSSKIKFVKSVYAQSHISISSNDDDDIHQGPLEIEVSVG